MKCRPYTVPDLCLARLLQVRMHHFLLTSYWTVFMISNMRWQWTEKLFRIIFITYVHFCNASLGMGMPHKEGFLSLFKMHLIFQRYFFPLERYQIPISLSREKHSLPSLFDIGKGSTQCLKTHLHLQRRTEFLVKKMTVSHYEKRSPAFQNHLIEKRKLAKSTSCLSPYICSYMDNTGL